MLERTRKRKVFSSFMGSYIEHLSCDSILKGKIIAYTWEEVCVLVIDNMCICVCARTQ